MTRCCFYSHNKQGRKYPFKYKYVSSVVNIKNKIPENHNLAKLLKDVHHKLTVFEVTEIDQDVVESARLDNKSFIDSIDECKVVVIILNEPLEDDTDEHSIFFWSKIEIVNCTFELHCEVITINIDHLRKWSGEVYSRNGGEFEYYC